nr:unnamed protein product [Callosobruchus chinensis]
MAGQYSYEDIEIDTTEEDDVMSGEYQHGTQNREIGDHIQSLPNNTLETKKRSFTQTGLSSTSSLLLNSPPKTKAEKQF